MNSVVDALEQIETLLLQQQAQINQVTSDVKELAKLLSSLTEAVAQKQQAKSEDAS